MWHKHIRYIANNRKKLILNTNIFCWTFGHVNCKSLYVIGFAVHFKMFYYASWYLVPCHCFIDLKIPKPMTYLRSVIKWRTSETIAYVQCNRNITLKIKVSWNKILTSSTARLFQTNYIPSSLFTRLVSIIFRIFCKGKVFACKFVVLLKTFHRR